MSRNRFVGALLVSALFIPALGARAQTAAAQPDPVAAAAFEIVTWNPQSPEIKFRETCVVAGEQVKCNGTFAVATVSGTGMFIGKARGNTWVGIGSSRGTDSNPQCHYSYENKVAITRVLNPDGTHTTTGVNSTVNYFSVSGACAPHMPRTSSDPGPNTTVGTWRLISLSDVPAVAENAPVAAPQTVIVIAPDGKTIAIDLSQLKAGKLTVEQMELAKQYALTPSSGGAGYTLQAWRYTGVQRNDLPVYEPMRRLDEVMAEGAIGAGTSALECAQGAASWAKANPAKASLMALSLAVSLAMPYTVAFQASAGGMTFLESAGIGFMTSAAPAAVQTLVTSAASGEGFWKSSGKAVLFGGIAGVESLVSTTVGAGVTGTVETGAALTQRLVGARISEQAVKGFGTVASGIAGSATDYGVGILHDQAADAIAQSAAKTTIPDLVPPARSTPAGGIVLPILSRTAAR